MIRIIKNTTISDIFVKNPGVTILASSQYTIPSNEYYLWTNQIDTLISSGNLVVNDGTVDLSIVKGKVAINFLIAKDVHFDNTLVTLQSTNVQSVIEELTQGYNLVSSVSSSTIVKTVNNTSDVLMSGMTISPAVGTHIVNFNGQYSSAVNSVTAQAASDLSSSIASLKALTATVTGHAPAFGGETLVAGVYAITGAGSLATTLILNGQNNANAVFVFRFSGAFSVATASSIMLINGANASNVFFISDGAISIAAGSTLVGSFFSSVGAVGLGASCTLTGRLTTVSGAITLDSSTITKPSVSTQITLGSIDNFAIFTSFGNITNTAVSAITGDVGTNSGTVLGLTAGMVTGTIYLPVASTSTIAFSLYSNNILVPNSKRVITRTIDVSGDSIQLHAIVSTLASQTIEVRINVIIGSITIGNRILTSVRVSG